MAEFDDLLAGIRAFPADELRRLVFADWLDEFGDTDRAEFVRVQCKLAEWVDLNAACVCRAAEDKFHCRRCLAWDETESIRHVERRLFCDHRPYDELRQHGLLLPRSWALPGHYTGTDGLMVLDRGFVAEVRLTLAAIILPSKRSASRIATRPTRGSFTPMPSMLNLSLAT